MASTFFITGDPDADQLLHDDPLALLLGMLFDQQVPMEWAFASPAKLRARLGHLDANKIEVGAWIEGNDFHQARRFYALADTQAGS